ncbi:MAG: hypothetical protein AB8F95_21425 [Bacteroidia bacterium]
MTIQSIRHRLISRIKLVNDPELLEKLASMMDDFDQGDEALIALVKPIRKTLDIEALAKEQNYSGFEKEEVDSLIEELDLEESLEELIAGI